MARYLVNTEQLRNCSKHLVTLISIHPRDVCLSEQSRYICAYAVKQTTL